MEKDFHLTRTLRWYEKTFAAIVIFFPLFITLIFICGRFYQNISVFTWILFFISCYLTMTGVILGFHRYLAHHSFTMHRSLKIILLLLACMAWQGPPLFWVAAHRRHHRFADEEGDPHSPIRAGFCYAHMGWMLDHHLESWRFYTKDLLQDQDVININRYFLFIALFGILIPGIINGIYLHSWAGFWQGIILCGIIRVFVTHHAAWSINSFAHLWGRRHFVTADHSKNNLFFGFFGFGEGWHNNHHAFPFSACYGLLWWQVDLAYYLLKILYWCGLVKQIKVPAPAQLDKKRIIL